MVQVSPDRIADRRREILRAASEVFRERGFHQAGMRDIAAALDVAVGQLYYYFRSKEDLLAFCQEASLSGLLEMADRVLALRGNPAELLHHLLVGHLRCLNEWFPGSLAHLEVEGLKEPRRSRILALRDRYEAVLRRVIARGIKSGAFRPVDPKVAALTLLGAVNWSVKWYRPGGGRTLTQLGRDFAEHLVRGILARPQDHRLPREDPFSSWSPGACP